MVAWAADDSEHVAGFPITCLSRLRGIPLTMTVAQAPAIPSGDGVPPRRRGVCGERLIA